MTQTHRMRLAWAVLGLLLAMLVAPAQPTIETELYDVAVATQAEGKRDEARRLYRLAIAEMGGLTSGHPLVPDVCVRVAECTRKLEGDDAALQGLVTDVYAILTIPDAVERSAQTLIRRTLNLVNHVQAMTLFLEGYPAFSTRVGPDSVQARTVLRRLVRECHGDAAVRLVLGEIEQARATLPPGHERQMALFDIACEAPQQHTDLVVPSILAEIAELRATRPLDDKDVDTLYRHLSQYRRNTRAYDAVMRAFGEFVAQQRPVRVGNTGFYSRVRNMILRTAEAGTLDTDDKLASAVYQHLKEALGPTHPATVGCLVTRAENLSYREKYDEAAALLTACRAELLAAHGPDAPGLAMVLHLLGSVHQARKQNAEAEEAWREAVRLEEAHFLPGRPDEVASLDDLADLYAYTNRFPQAEALRKRHLAACEAAYGPESERLYLPLTELAYLYSDFGKWAESIPLRQRRFEIAARHAKPGDTGLISYAGAVVWACFYAGRYADAEAWVARMRTCEDGAGRPEANRESTFALGCIYQAWGKSADALPLLQRTLEEHCREPRHSAWGEAVRLVRLALCLHALGRHAEADQHCTRAETLLAGEDGDTGDLIWALRMHAPILRALNRPDDAANAEARAQALREKQ